ncbi:MAG: hypothetical protein HW391_1846 [Chloroflexi bacterium]|nr:hypothetical protein [Chloroflexota bacterium]
MLNAPAGALRAIARFRPTKSERSERAKRFHGRSIGLASGLGVRISAAIHPSRVVSGSLRERRGPLTVALRRGLTVRLASERMIPVMAALVVLGASLVSLQPASAQPTGDTAGAGTGPRIAIGGEASTQDQLDPMEVAALIGGPAAKAGAIDAAAPQQSSADDGTIWMPPCSRPIRSSPAKP